MFSLGIAVGKQTHTVVVLGEGEKFTERYIANSAKGAVQVCKMLGEQKQVVFFGNHRWATPIAYALQAKGVSCFYFSLKQERGSRGPVGNVSKLLVKMMQKGARAREFFREPKKSGQEEEMPTTYRIAEEYLNAANAVREAKHRILDCIGILFPEVVKAKTTEKKGKDGRKIALPVPRPQPSDIFTKKMRPVLDNPDPRALATDKTMPHEVRILARRSLALYVPDDARQTTLVNYQEHLANFDQFAELKERKMDELREAVGDHPLVEHFGGGDLIYILLAMLAWRDWPRWRELRHFCGLDVSRIDSKGKARISRVRPHTRQYLYLLATMTKRGKEVTQGVKKRVKKIERLLKYLRNHSLKGPEVQIREADVT